jgi:hypothetical protein
MWHSLPSSIFGWPNETELAESSLLFIHNTRSRPRFDEETMWLLGGHFTSTSQTQ